MEMLLHFLGLRDPLPRSLVSPLLAPPPPRLDLARGLAIQSSNPGQACPAPPIPLWPGAWVRRLSGTDRPTDRLTDGQRHRQCPMASPGEPCVGPRVSVSACPTLLSLACWWCHQVVTLGREETPRVGAR